ncbi:MAG: 3-oxoacyl-[acyl-carrier-protein] synthase III C-terminal domain-containing protein [Micropruina sp.]|uniref:3-oxoacyl-[acyl-carrier-protein] synthase III C-terminal domain-containing protein n=1 Tax=Micropruina sp. TaxID=2737536 RepID=UPI0039E6138E
MSWPVRIVSVGSHTPAVRVSSAELDAAHGRASGTTLARSGVVARHWIGPDETSLGMTADAVAQALDRAGWSVDDLDALIVASVAPEQPMPTTAMLTAARLGARDGVLQAFDVNASCLGFLTALQQACFGMAAGGWRRVAVAAVDIASKGLNHADLESSALFGDGAAAVLLERSPSSEILALRLTGYPSAAGLCRIPAGGTRWNAITPPPSPDDYLFTMDGLGMMKLVAREMPGFLDGLLAEAGVSADAIDAVVPHQASGLGLRFLRERLPVRPGTVIDILAERGNQVSASMPTALAHAVDTGRLRRGQLCLLIGTGAGLLFGGAVLRY